MLPVPAIMPQIKNVEEHWKHDEDAGQHHEQGKGYDVQEHLQAQKPAMSTRNLVMCYQS